VPDGPTFLLFVGASLALLLIPGPAVIYLVTRSLDQGRQAGIVSVLGIETGTFVYALAAAAGLTGLIAASETGFAIVKFAGAAYLVYLGVTTLLGRRRGRDVAPGGRSDLYLKVCSSSCPTRRSRSSSSPSCRSSSIRPAARTPSRS
jgi:threonine/homoserine/homoserine lactone efflux protein